MRTYAWLFIVVLLAGTGLPGCDDSDEMQLDAPPKVVVPPPTGHAPQPMYQYEHELKGGGAAGAAAMAAEFVIAVARVGDTSPVGSPFGDKQVQLPSDVTIKSSGQGPGETRTTAGVDESLRAEKLAPEPVPAGFGQEARTQLISLLTGAGCFTVIERESINDILREQQFSSSEWVMPSGGAAGELAAVRYIVKGALQVQQVPTRQVTPGNWTDTTISNDQQPYVFHLRMYSVRTSQVVAVGDGYAATPSAAVEAAVSALRRAAMNCFKQMSAAEATTQPKH